MSAHVFRPGKPLSRRQVVRRVCCTLAVALSVLAVGVWSLVSIVLSDSKKIDALYVSASANRSKLVAEGLAPVGPPPEQIVGKEGPQGDPGPQGGTGPMGPAGTDGRNGKDASPAQVASAVAAYLKAHPVKDGKDGKDATAAVVVADPPAVACVAEVTECRGLDGADGVDGKDGKDGARGEPPSSWLWTDPATHTSYECRRDASSPDSAPAYACAVVG